MNMSTYIHIHIQTLECVRRYILRAVSVMYNDMQYIELVA
jgi:hypothetical protein